MTRWFQYQRPGSAGCTRVHVGRRRRRILLALLTGAANLGGFTICQAAQCGSGTVYPFLAHLERAGWVTSEWESPEPVGRPRRRFYRLTAEGRAGTLMMLGLRVTDTASEKQDSDA